MTTVIGIISTAVLVFALYKHRAEHEFCPEALFAVFDTFIALGIEGDPSAFITEEYPLPGFGG